jgi:hypothetical protein
VRSRCGLSRAINVAVPAGRNQKQRNTKTGALDYAQDDSSSIVQSAYEFSDIFNAFTGFA